jgi:hypothetical protein
MRQVKKTGERQQGGDGSTAGIGNVQTILHWACGTISRPAASPARGYTSTFRWPARGGFPAASRALFYLFFYLLLMNLLIGNYWPYDGPFGRRFQVVLFFAISCNSAKAF